MWDAIVVGAGPAGIAAAMAIHRDGGRVALLDRKAFPRPKACAGMLSALALQTAPFPVTPVIRSVPRTLVMHQCGREQMLQERNYLTHRIELDDHLFREAVTAGVTFFRVPGLAKLVNGPVSVRISTHDHRFFTARALIAADGANSQVRRLLGLPAACRDAFSVEIDLALPGDARQTPPWMDFDLVPGGYGWLFPKGDSCNVGIAVMGKAGEEGIGTAFARFLADHAAGADAIGRARGAAIGAYGPLTRLGQGRVLLCGDAASLADPWTGEGISHAFVSGQLAGLAVMRQPAAPLACYEEAMQPTLGQLAKRQEKQVASYGVTTLG